MKRLAPIVLCAALLACPKPPPPAPVLDAGSVDAGVAERAAELEVRVTALLVDGGTVAVDFAGSERPVIDPARGLRVETNLLLRNYRVRVFDEVDRAMVSDDRADEREDGVQYEISFAEPLKSGHKYAIVLDAQTGATMTDARGSLWPEVRLNLQVSGEKEKPAPAKKKRRRR